MPKLALALAVLIVFISPTSSQIERAFDDDAAEDEGKLESEDKEDLALSRNPRDGRSLLWFGSRGTKTLPQQSFMEKKFEDPVCNDYKDVMVKQRAEKSYACGNCAGTWGSYWHSFMKGMGYRKSSFTDSSTLFHLVYTGTACIDNADNVSKRKGIRLCARVDELPIGFASKGSPEKMMKEYCKRHPSNCPLPVDSFVPKHFIASDQFGDPLSEAISKIEKAEISENKKRELFLNSDEGRRMQERMGRSNETLTSISTSAWILKALAGYASKGNEIVRSLSEALKVIKEKKLDSFLLQEYEMRPLLHQGRKISLRCFVVILSMKPLRVVYVDGPVFRAVKKYDGYGFDRLAHLTNAFFEAPQFKSQTAKLEEDTILNFRTSIRDAVAELNPEYEKLPDRFVDESLRPTIKSIAKTAVLALYEHANKDFIKNFEGMTGVPLCFDFMINDDLRVWFHEYNVGCGLRGSPSLPNQWRVDSFGNTLLLMEELHYRIQRGDVSTRLSDMCWSPFLTRDYTNLEILIDGEADA